MNQVQIILEAENGNGNVKLLYNGQQMPTIFDINLHFNSRTGELEFKGQRFKTDKAGQYFVDSETKDTAMEDINLLNLFNPHIMNREYMLNQQKALEFGLLNVYLTSMLNAKNLIKERKCELRKVA
jgi:hypothetical protein